MFETLLSYVTKHYYVTSFSKLHEAPKDGKPLLILSFDDGYYDFIEYALPILKKYNLPANHNLVNACLNTNQTIWTQRLNCIFNHLRENNIFQDDMLTEILPGKFDGKNWHNYYLKFLTRLLDYNMADKLCIIGRLEERYQIRSNYRMLCWDDVRGLLKENVEIGSHTYNHDSLTQLNTQALLDSEILRSKLEMEAELNAPVNIIAFPNGRYNHTVMDYCREIGFKYILLLDDKVTKMASLNSSENGNVISRIGIASESPKEAILRVELFHPIVRKLRRIIGIQTLSMLYGLYFSYKHLFMAPGLQVFAENL